MTQAERAVHLSGALSAGSSLLETECASRLDSALHPGLRHLLRWLADCHPQLAPLATCADEVFLLLSTLLHYHYLHERGGSFGECFYGLMRKPRSDDDGIAPGSLSKTSSLLWLTAFPYLLLKLEQKLSAYRLQVADGVLVKAAPLERHLKQLACWLGGLTHAAASCWHVGELTSGGGSTPALRVQGLRLSPGLSAAEPGAPLQALAFAAQLAGATTGPGESTGRVVLAPPPPEYDVRALTHAGKCPLCGKSPPVSPTAIATSGYVFCFSCIMHHVQASNDARCPVTSLPVSLQHLVRIYQSQTS